MDIVDSNVCHDKCLTRNKGKTAIVTELHYFLTYSKCPFSQCNILTNQWTTDYGLMVSRSKIHNGRNPHPKIPKNQNIPLKCMKCLNYQFWKKSLRKNATLSSWTLFQHIWPHFWVWLLLYSAITPKSEDKYVVKVFNSTELHFFEVFKIGSLTAIDGKLSLTRTDVITH